MGRVIWTYERVLEISKDCKSRSELERKHPTAYNVSRKNKWLDLLTHLKPSRKKAPHGYWQIKENVQKEALKYNTRFEFCKGSRGAYGRAFRNGWLDEVCSHMSQMKERNKMPRYIYVFIWEKQKLAYVGLTAYPRRRKNNHLNNVKKKSSVYETKKVYGEPEFRILTPVPVDVDKAPDEEERWYNIYSEMGYTMVNKQPTGSIGGCVVIWTFDKIHEESKKYIHRIDFSKNSRKAYVAAQKQGILDEVCSHMIPKPRSGKNRSGKKGFNYNQCKNKVSEFKTLSEFTKEANGYYQKIHKMGWTELLNPLQRLGSKEYYLDNYPIVIRMIEEGRSNREIADATNNQMKLVRNIRKKFKEWNVNQYDTKFW